MRYALLIHYSEAAMVERSEAEQEEIFQEYWKFTQDLVGAGAMRAGEALQPTATATTVSVGEGGTVTTDGPFAETKEQLGGFYIIDVENLDQAIEWAAQIPDARAGVIEVRPILEIEGAPRPT